jgi:hypothetical protein
MRPPPLRSSASLAMLFRKKFRPVPERIIIRHRRRRRWPACPKAQASGRWHRRMRNLPFRRNPRPERAYPLQASGLRLPNGLSMYPDVPPYPYRPGARWPLCWPLRSGTQALGRSRTCDISFPDDSNVSRRHCAVTVDGSGVTIEDLGSSNGTYVDGRRLRLGERVHVGDGVRFRLADEWFHCEWR